MPSIAIASRSVFQVRRSMCKRSKNEFVQARYKRRVATRLAAVPLHGPPPWLTLTLLCWPFCACGLRDITDYIHPSRVTTKHSTLGRSNPAASVCEEKSICTWQHDAWLSNQTCASSVEGDWDDSRTCVAASMDAWSGMTTSGGLCCVKESEAGPATASLLLPSLAAAAMCCDSAALPSP